MGRAERIIRKRIEQEQRARPATPSPSRIFRSNYEAQSPIIQADMLIREFVTYMERNDYPDGQLVGGRAAWHVGSFARYYYETTTTGSIYILSDGRFLIVEENGSFSKPTSFAQLCRLMENGPKYVNGAFSADEITRNIERLSTSEN